MLTPWGDSTTLRERRLRPGPGADPAAVAANQRERLFAAMVAVVSERGYGAARVADVVELSGVSTRSFYSLFADKEALLLATVEEILGGAAAMISAAATEAPERERAALERAAELVRGQPAAARVYLIEAPAAGPRVRARMDASIDALSALAAEVAGRRRGSLPEELIAAWTGGLLSLARDLLLEGREDELPEVFSDCAEIFDSYEPPEAPLRPVARAPRGAPQTLEGHDHAQRAIRALAYLLLEHELTELSTEDILRRAGMSATTFYAHFSGKDDLLRAAIDDAGAQLVAATLPVFARTPEWGPGVRAALGAIFSLLAHREDLANLLLLDYVAGGAEAMRRRAAALRPLAQIFEGARLYRPDATPVLGEGMVGCVLAMAAFRLRASGPRSLPALTPSATHMVLAPFLGSQAAEELANSGASPRSLAAPGGAMERLIEDPTTPRILDHLERAHRARPGRPLTFSAKETASELSLPTEKVAAALDALVQAGAFRRRTGGESRDELLYVSMLQLMWAPEWSRLTVEERERISAPILELVAAEIATATRAGSFDARAERHLVRFRAQVDEEGWAELSSIYDEAIVRAEAAIGRAEERLAEGEETPIEARLVHLLFEMPEPE